ncbi:PSD1 and planctomycete cytochrome C domain-containing protein [soil metagenome]
MRNLLFLFLIMNSFTPVKSIAAQPVDYNRDIRPILATQCYACHGPDEKTRKADLRLDLRDVAVKTGAIVPGKPAESTLLARITSKDNDEVMPPAKSKKPPLTPEQIDLFKRWIAEGANYSEHWSFVKLTQPAVPESHGLPNPVDRFLLARLKKEGITPSPEVDRAALIRRLSFDLTGLPPTPEDVRGFVEDKSPDAYAKLVDKLLASPHYGERMALWWLDLVRFADSAGYHSDNEINVAPYREWVISSFNANQRYDQFTIEQLAGDLLPNPTQSQRIATAYNRLLQTTEEGGAQAEEYIAKYSSDRVRNYGQVWLGGTIMCAECHNHKFDPYTQKDFYATAAFFADVQEAPLGRREPGMVLASPDQEQQIGRLAGDIDKAKVKLDTAATAFAAEPEAFAEVATWLNPKPAKGAKAAAPVATPADVKKILALDAAKRTQADKDRLAAFARENAPNLKKERDDLAKATKTKKDYRGTIPKTLITTATTPRTVRILARGNWQDKTGEVVLPNTPGFLPPLPAKEGRYTRMDLAKWTVAQENPLTARVAVNRLWKLFFGYGIARSLEETGAQGQLPTHPELLDWLAVEFRETWDIKKLVRLMVMSQAYRQSSLETPTTRERDPFNKLFARQSRWRLEAEFVRDNTLAISGLLSAKVGGESVKPYQPPGYWAALNFPVREWKKDDGEKTYRRGLYTHWQRSFPHPAMVAFDATSREECTAERPRSNIPQQALVLLNDPEFVESAKAFAVKVLADGGKDDDAKLAWAFARATGRTPNAEETKVILTVLAKHRKEFAANPEDVKKLLAVGEAKVPAESAELAAWTSVCRVVLNLHETITRQ